MGRARPSRRHVWVLLGICIASLCQQHVFSIPKLIRKNAGAAKIDPVQFLESIEQKAGDWQAGRQIAGRSEFMGRLRKVMTKSGLHMVIGGKSLGKTKIIESITKSLGFQYPLLAVDMRDPPLEQSINVLECLQEVAKTKWTDENLPEWLQPLVAGFKAFLPALGKAEGRADDDTAKLLGATVTSLGEVLGIPTPSKFLKEFVDAGQASGRVPVIIIDEANIAFPNGNGGNGNGRKAAAEAAIALFVALSKQKKKACVILVASEYSFPYRLETLGFNKYDSLSIILAPEVEEEAMIEVLTEKWGMPQDLAEAFYEAFGGDIYLCDQALSNLVEMFSMGDEDDFDPYRLRDNFGLDGLVMDTSTRPQMEDLARQGWSAIAASSTENQTAAKNIAKMNFGAVIGSKSILFGSLRSLKREMFKDEKTTQVLIPTTQYMRKCIQRMVEAVWKEEAEEAARNSWWRRILRLLGSK